MCIPCSCPEECQRMHDVKNFNNDTVYCGDFEISISRYCRLLGDTSEDVPVSPCRQFLHSCHLMFAYASEVVPVSLCMLFVYSCLLMCAFVYSCLVMGASRAGHGASSEQIAIQGKKAKQFNVLKSVVSKWYDSNNCLTMLKVLFRDHVDNGKLSRIINTMDLLNELVKRDHLHVNNLALLCDTISITKHFVLQRKIQEILPSFPDVKEGTISEKFTIHRQKLMKCGMALTPRDVTEIDGLYNIPLKHYTDSWSMIADLENRLVIINGDMKDFIDILKKLENQFPWKALRDELQSIQSSN
ncbi:uncharacterized protein LOC117102575 [Anneissia japonica]|uniref:uncharacterized protein LOC117102575 n=1 Tax=Anneissia japonica TaxID=1529436 RepID=UPI001425ACC7|nr:uncharacterized protein LOC117102575 [Anneissia japonica]